MIVPESPSLTHMLRRFGLHPTLTLVAIVAGFVTRQTIGVDAGDTVWMVGLVLTGAPVAWRTLRGMLHGQFATDVVAMLAVIGAVALGEPFAGLVVVLMQTGGEALERYAEGRASDAVRELERAAPTIAHRVWGDAVDDIAVEDVDTGDMLLVRAGEIVPCDAVVINGQSHADTSRITGEPMPVRVVAGSSLQSGVSNLEGPIHVRASAPARESQYARIVQLVRTAQSSKAPIQRLADRYAIWFTPLTLVVCTATWFLSHEAVRVLAVLVVATPCPLILATPVAVVGGINRAARRGILFRHGTALEQIATIDVAVFDKTGTLTIGRPRVSRVEATDSLPADELLRLAAAVEQGSGHLLARTVIEEALARGLVLPRAEQVSEAPGRGVAGLVDGREVAVGGRQWVQQHHATQLAAEDDRSGGLKAWVAVDRRVVGVITFADEQRPGLQELFAGLRASGVRRIVLLSGDDAANTRLMASGHDFDAVHGDLLPADKTAMVHALMKGGDRVLMMGDGTNDAPALSTATVGVALASGGGGIAAEAADAVILADDPTRVTEAITIARRTLRIARQSIGVGLGLSSVAMGFAATGYLAPAIGALIQEAIDVAVILNAIRASRSPFPPHRAR
jgi:heavy metal translocating P-type ATPase